MPGPKLRATGGKIKPSANDPTHPELARLLRGGRRRIGIEHQSLIPLTLLMPGRVHLPPAKYLKNT